MGSTLRDFASAAVQKAVHGCLWSGLQPPLQHLHDYRRSG